MIKAILQAIFGSLLDRFFPPKTAADQKVDNISKELKGAENANKISTEVDQESRADVDADMAKFVRPE